MGGEKCLVWNATPGLLISLLEYECEICEYNEDDEESFKTHKNDEHWTRVAKKRDPGILDPEPFLAQIRKVEARLGKLEVRPKKRKKVFAYIWFRN